MKKLFVILTLSVFVSCSSVEDFDKGKKQLENMGYSNIKNTGYSSFCCSDSDTYSTGFTCNSKDGEVVEGCFCSSGMKGITIRFK